MSTFTENASNNAPAVALPHEIPPAPRLADVPARILHSATVETLIDHTEDLTSRLKVHIRRNGQLEGQIVELEEQVYQSELMRQTLIAQIEILREKDRSIADKHAAHEAQNQRVKEELDLFRLENKELTTRNSDLQKSTAKAWAYKRRFLRWVYPGIESREKQLKILRSRMMDLEAESLRMSSTISSLREELSHQRSDSDRRLTAGERDRARLVGHYEQELKKSQAENTLLKADLAKAAEKLEVLDRATNESAKANNEKVFFERRTEELESRLSTETERLRGTVSDLANECSTLRASVETARKLREESDAARIQAEDGRNRAEAQLAGMRDVWQETTVRLQALEAQNEALERINGELSKKLAQSRESEKRRVSDQALDRVGFVESEETARQEKLKKLDLILTDLEMKAFGLQPPDSP